MASEVERALEKILEACPNPGKESFCEKAGCTGIHSCASFIAARALNSLKSGEVVPVNGKVLFRVVEKLVASEQCPGDVFSSDRCDYPHCEECWLKEGLGIDLSKRFEKAFGLRGDDGEGAEDANA